MSVYQSMDLALACTVSCRTEPRRGGVRHLAYAMLPVGVSARCLAALDMTGGGGFDMTGWGGLEKTGWGGLDMTGWGGLGMTGWGGLGMTGLRFAEFGREALA